MTFAEVQTWILMRLRRSSSNESLINEWTTLETLWLTAQKGEPVPPAETISRINALLAARTDIGNAEGWKRFNEAEQRVGQELTAEQLPVEFKGLLDLAKARNVNVATHEARLPTFAEATKLKDQRAAYQALLYELQSNFINGRLSRSLRSEVATRLFRYGVGALVLACVVPTLFARDYHDAVTTRPPAEPKTDLAMTLFSHEPAFGLAMVASFGILGALFSRVLTFQDPTRNLTLDDVMRTFIGKVLRIRLLVGLIAAVIFYILLRGGLVAGSVFPDLKLIGITEQPIWLLGDDGPLPRSSGHFARAGLTILTPTADLAKLLLWSFLAGFSERLVPDALARAEAQGAKTNV